MRRFFVVLTAVVVYIFAWGWRFLSFIGAADAAMNMSHFVDVVRSFVIARQEIGWQIAPWLLMFGSTALLAWLAWPEFKERHFGGESPPPDKSTAEPPISNPEKPSAAKTDAPERVRIDVKPEHLVGLYKGHTDVQGRALGEDFLRKRIEVSGPLGNVFNPSYTGELEWTKSKKTMMVTFANRGFGSDLAYVSMRFNEEWFGRLRLIPLNKNISVEGQIIEFNRTGLELWNCEIVNPDAQSANAAISSSSQT